MLTRFNYCVNSHGAVNHHKFTQGEVRQRASLVSSLFQRFTVILHLLVIIVDSLARGYTAAPHLRLNDLQFEMMSGS